MGLRRELGDHRSLDRVDLNVRDRCQPIPSVSQDADNATSLTDFDVTCMVHLVVRKEVAGKHGHADVVSNPVAPRPGLDFWKKEVESLGGQLIMHQLFAVALRPQRIPLRRLGLRECRLQDHRATQLSHGVLRAGSAPFGSGPFSSDQTVNKCSILLEAKGPSLPRLGFPYPKFPGNTGRVTPWPFIPPSRSSPGSWADPRRSFEILRCGGPGAGVVKPKESGVAALRSWGDRTRNLPWLRSPHLPRSPRRSPCHPWP